MNHLKLTASLSAALALPAAAQTASSPAKPNPPAQQQGEQVMETVTVYGETEEQGSVQKPFPPAVEGVKIFAGKRASVIDLDALPKVQANNYRQALALTPGLLISEESTPLVSLGYRGIGEPNRSQFLQVLKDGIPIHADPFGYPEAYYTPPLDVVDRMEFIRGGGALMYGAQPAGALNYITHMPGTDKPFSFRTQNIFGSDDLFSSYTALDGTVGNFGYLGYYNHRESDGFRSANSDYTLDGAHAKLVFQQSEATRWILALDWYEEEHGEPGGLTQAQYAADRNQATKLNDRFALKRNAASIELQHEVRPGFDVNVKAWGGYYDRWSRRENFGANAGTNNIERQEFNTFGIEPRMRYDWSALGGEHTFTGGFQYYTADSPRTDKRGASPTANDGALQRKVQRDLDYWSIFAENKFTFGRLSITPGVRVEMIDQLVTRTFPSELAKDNSVIEPLLGLGLSYELDSESEIYANASQSYRGTIFTETLIPSAGTVVGEDIDPARTWTYELGMRGNPLPWLTYDTSVFYIDMENRYGVFSNTLGNVGRAINYGWDAAVQADLIALWDEKNGTTFGETLGSLSLYANVSLLEAEFENGRFDGGRPQYTPGLHAAHGPDLVKKTGLRYHSLARSWTIITRRTMELPTAPSLPT